MTGLTLEPVALYRGFDSVINSLMRPTVLRIVAPGETPPEQFAVFCSCARMLAQSSR